MAGSRTWGGEEWSTDADCGVDMEAATELQIPVSLVCLLRKEQGMDRRPTWADDVDEMFSTRK